MTAELKGAARTSVALKARRLYEQDGWSIRAIAREINRSYGFTHHLLVEAGVTLRTKTGQPRKPRQHAAA